MTIVSAAETLAWDEAPLRVHMKAPVSRALGRPLDTVIAALAIVFLLPMFVLVALLIASSDAGPVLFKHRRVGRDGRFFNVYKFRSMRADADRLLAEHLAADPDAMAEWARDHKLRDDPRVTRVGYFLRKSSLDELPQLFNVLKGDMSLVGPRPIVQPEIEKYGALFAAYCQLRPGMTGVWQVSGRNDVSYEERVRMDAGYVAQKSVPFDLYVMLMTVPAVLMRRGSY